MFSPLLLKLVDWMLAISMLVQPILAAIQPEVVRAVPAETAPHAAPEAAVADRLTATVPGPLLASSVPEVSAEPSLAIDSAEQTNMQLETALQNAEWPPANADFTVNTRLDGVDAYPGNSKCATTTGECTLRAAIMEANRLPGAQVIALPATQNVWEPYMLTIVGTGENDSETGDLDITGDLTLVGQDAATTIIAAYTDDRVLHIPSQTPLPIVSISGVAIQDGRGTYEQPIDRGGGILNEGSLTLTNTFVRSNLAEKGGGIFTAGDIIIINSVISDNVSVVNGAGIWAGGGNLHIRFHNATITNNNLTADRSSEQPYDMGMHAVVYDSEDIGNLVEIENTIIANYPARNCLVMRNGIPDIPSFTSLGHNLSSDATCNLIHPTDLPNTDPRLDLAHNDYGWSLGYMLLPSSPAIDAGNNATCPVQDQRGVPRPQGEACDIGAYENGPGDIDFTVNSESDMPDFAPGNGICETATGNGICTLRAAIMETNELDGEETVVVPGGDYVFAGETGHLTIGRLILVGESATTTIVTGLHIDVGTASIDGMTLQNGGIYINGGGLSLTNSVIKNGSGITNVNNGALRVVNSIISDNTTGVFGDHSSYSTLINTTIKHNTAPANGGGIWASWGAVFVIINSTISENSAELGGGIYYSNRDGWVGRVHLLNSTVTNNNAQSGGGIVSDGDSPVTLENTIVAGNTGQNCLVVQQYDPNPIFQSVSLGHNLSDDGTCNLTDPTDIDVVGINPGLGPLQDNGGPTPTHALLNGSPAVDKIDAEDCPATDQRDVERPQGAKCDIGAYEKDGPDVLYGTTRRTGGGTDWPVDNYAKQTQAYVGNPINTASGNQTYETTDLRLPTPAGDITFSRSYSSYNAFYDSTEIDLGFQYKTGSLGPGWMHNYETHLKFPFGNDVSKIGLLTPGATYVIFKQKEEADPDPDPGVDHYTSEGIGGEITTNATHFVYTSPEGIQMFFYDRDMDTNDNDGMDQYLEGRLDKINFQLTGVIDLEYFQYTPGTYLLEYVRDSTAPETRYMEFTYQTYEEDNGDEAAIRLQSILLPLADGYPNRRSVSFAHQPFHQATTDGPLAYWNTNLIGVTDVRGKYWSYVYADEDTHADPEPAEEPDLTLDFILYPYLRHFLAGRQMPPLPGQSVGAPIINYWYQLISGSGYVPAARAVREDNGAGQPTLNIEYGTSLNPTIIHTGADSSGPTVEHTYNSDLLLTQQRIISGAGMSLEENGWRTNYPLDSLRPNRTLDPLDQYTDYEWTDNHTALEAVANTAGFVFYQYVSLTAGLHLPELIFYPFEGGEGAAPQRVQTRLIYNTSDVTDLNQSFAIRTEYPEGDDAFEAQRVPNPYGQKPYPGLPERLLVARIDDPSGPGGGLTTRYYYYTIGNQAGLVSCIDVPPLRSSVGGGDTFTVYNDVRQPVDIYQNTSCFGETHSGGQWTHITYDPLNRVAETTGPDSMVTRYEYVGQSDLVRVVTQHANDSKGILAEDANGDTWNIKTIYYYDVAGRLLATIENYDPAYSGGVQVNPDLDGDGVSDGFHLDPAAPHLNRATVYRYDQAGRVEQVTANYHPDRGRYEAGYNFATRTVYDGAGRSAAVIENYTPAAVEGVSPTPYDLDGDGEADLSLALSADAPDLNRITLSRYNTRGQLMQVISPVWPSPSGKPVPYQPHTTSDGQTVLYNRVTAYEYDLAGNVITTIANYDRTLTGGLSLAVQLEPTLDDPPLSVKPGYPDRNIATCTEYDVLNRPVFTRTACVDEVGAYHSEGGSVYNRVSYTAYDALSRPVVQVVNYKPGTNGLLPIDAEYNHVTRLYYDSLGRTEWVVREMTGDTTQDIVDVLDSSILGSPDHNLVTRTYYDELGQPIASVENYRETFEGLGSLDLILTAPEIEYGLSKGYNHVTRTFYGSTGLVSAVTDNFVGGITGATEPPAFALNQPDRNLTTLYEDYDELRRLTQLTVSRLDQHITSLVEYDNLGRVDWRIDDSDHEPRTTQIDYANLGFSVTTIDPSDRVVRTTADVRGNPSTTVAPGTLDLTVGNTYDLFGRVTSSHDGVTNHAAVKTAYDALGQVLQVSSTGQVTIDGQLRNVSQVTTYSYNLLGQVGIVKVTGHDAKGRDSCSATQYQYNNSGQLLRVVENFTTLPGVLEGCDSNIAQEPMDIETEYLYDMAGNLETVELANGATRQYQYDALGQATFEVLDPAGQQMFSQYCYNAVGNVTLTIRGKGKTSAVSDWCTDTPPTPDDPPASIPAEYLATVYRYDALGRPAKINYEPAGNGLEAAADVEFTYDSFGNRKTMSETGGRIWSYTSTRDGLLKTVNWQKDNQQGTSVTYGYDPTGIRTNLQIGNQTPINYVPDAAGRLWCIDGNSDHNSDGACTNAAADGDVIYTYNKASQVEKVELPNGIVSTYTYDPLGQLKTIFHKRGIPVYASYTYTSDGLGSRIGANEYIGGPSSQPLTLATFGTANPDEDVALPGFMPEIDVPDASSSLAGGGEVKLPVAPEPAPILPEAAETPVETSTDPQASILSELPEIMGLSALIDSQALDIPRSTRASTSSVLSPLEVGYYEETDARLEYSGMWTAATNSGTSGGAFKYTTEQNATVRISFTGNGVTLYRALGPTRGNMQVCIDPGTAAEECVTVNNYAATLQLTQPWIRSELTFGPHEIIMRNLDAGKYLDLDAIEVLGPTVPLEAGTHQETHPNIIYSGTWTNASNSSASGGTLKYTNLTNVKIRFSFNGNKLTLYRTLYSNRGPMEVCIDGVCQAVQNYATALQWQQPWTTSGLATAVHEVTIRNTSTAYIDLDALKVETTPAPEALLVGYYQETDARLEYSGTWTAATNSGTSGGAFKYTTEQNASVRIGFTGNGVTLSRALGPTRGNMQVCIDPGTAAEECVTVNNYAATLQLTQPWTRSGLTFGPHEITMRNLDAGKYLDLDAVEVLGPTVPLEAGTHQETHPNIIYSGTWTNGSNSSASGGTLKYTNLTNVKIRFSFNGNKLTLYRTLYSNRAPMNVCIDGVCQTVQNYATTLQWQQPWAKSGLTTAVHEVTIHNLGTTDPNINIIDLDAVKVETVSPPEALAVGYYEETDARLEYSGMWTAATNSGASSGALKYTTEQNASVRISFTGNGVTLYRALGPTGGNMQVCIDPGTAAEECVTVNNYAATLQLTQPWTRSGLTFGPHEVTMRNLDAGKYLDLDAVEVLALLETGLHEETDPRITYSGEWVNRLTPLASGGSYKRTDRSTTTASFAFAGSRLVLYYAQSDWWSMQVCIDEVCETVDASSSFLWKQPWVKLGLSEGIHKVTLSNCASSAFCGLDAIEVLGPPLPLGVGLHQETNVNLDYYGAWLNQSAVESSGLIYKSTAQQGADVTFQIDGAEMVLYRSMGPYYGLMSVCIDSDPCDTVQNIAPIQLWQQPWRKTGLAPTVHTVTITNISAQTIDLDAIEVLDGQQHPLPQGLHQQNNPQLTYHGVWQTELDTALSGGSTAYTSEQGATVSFQINGTGLVIYRTMDSDRGPMEVCIDTDCLTVENTAATRMPQQMWLKGELTAGVHNITLRSLSASPIDFDAVEVLDPLTVGLVQETDSRIVYYRDWYPSQPLGPDGITVMETNGWYDASASFWFDGTGVVIHRMIGPSPFYGSMEMCIDGVCDENSSFTYASTQVRTWVKSGLAAGLHRVTLSSPHYMPIAIDAVEVLGESQPLDAGLHQETDPNLVYSGSWRDLYDSLSTGFALYTGQQGARVSFQFDGVGLTLYRSTGPTQGSMDVCIDGRCTVVDNQSATAQWSQPWTSAGLSDGTHDVTLTSLSTSAIDLESVEVLAPTVPLEVGTYEETEPRLDFIGTWTGQTDSNASGGAFTETSQKDAVVRFSFEGNKLVLFRSTGDGRGSMEVCIDGLCETVPNTSATTLWQQPWASSALTMAVHQVSIRSTSDAPITLDAVLVDETEGPQPLGPGFYEETEPRLVYSGGWSSATASGASGGSVRLTSDPDAGVAFSFIGDGLVLYRTTAPGYGQMEVCIDQACVTVDNFSTLELRQQPWTSDALEAGLHQVTLRNISTVTIDLDAVEVQGEPQPLEAGYYEETNNNLTYQGQWTPQTGSGLSGDSLTLTADPAAGLSFRFNGNLLTLYRTMGPAYGLMQVCIDGGCTQVQNNAVAEQWQQPWTSPDLASGVHEVVISPVAAASINLDAIRVMAPLGVGLHQEDNVRISYSGNWEDVSGTGPIGGAMRTTSDPAGTVSFQFEGTKLTLYRALGPDYGPVQVCIDGTCETMENTAPSMQWAEPWVKSGLPSGLHSVVVENPESSTYTVDAARITGPHNWAYQYDGLGRLVMACSNGWNADIKTCTGDRFSYSYDRAGNLEDFSRAVENAARADNIHFSIDNATNQVRCIDRNHYNECDTGEPIWQYDNLGNLTSDGVTTYTYDTANRLVRVVGPAGTTTYEYNGDGDRVAETHGEERTEFTLDVASSLTQVLAETNTSTGQTISYLYGLGLVAQTSGGATEYHLNDGLGSVRQIAGTDGSVLLGQTFDPYGNRFELSASSAYQSAQSPFGWTGEQSDPNGLTYLRARYYNPSMGRFTQIDPFAGALALPSSLNSYAYGHGNPTRYTDPEGLCGPLCWAAITIGLVGVGVFAWDYISQADYNIRERGMDFWTAMDPANVDEQRSITYGLIAAGIATAGIVGCTAAPEICLGLAARGFVLLEAGDAIDDMLTYWLALNGDEEAAAQLMVMSQASPLDGPNSLLSIADDVVEASSSFARLANSRRGIKYPLGDYLVGPDDYVDLSGLRRADLGEWSRIKRNTIFLGNRERTFYYAKNTQMDLLPKAQDIPEHLRFSTLPPYRGMVLEGCPSSGELAFLQKTHNAEFAVLYSKSMREYRLLAGRPGTGTVMPPSDMIASGDWLWIAHTHPMSARAFDYDTGRVIYSGGTIPSGEDLNMLNQFAYKNGQIRSTIVMHSGDTVYTGQFWLWDRGVAQWRLSNR